MPLYDMLVPGAHSLGFSSQASIFSYDHSPSLPESALE